MIIPTYYDGLVKDVSPDENFVTMWLSNERNGDWYEIYYYGEIEENGYLYGTENAPEFLVAKSVKSGDQIIIYDGSVHGYDNMFCNSYQPNDLTNRELTKMVTAPVKVKISLEYSIDYESEKEEYDFVDENHVKLVDGKIISWDDVKRNGITWIVVTLINGNGKRLSIIDAELA